MCLCVRGKRLLGESKGAGEMPMMMTMMMMMSRCESFQARGGLMPRHRIHSLALRQQRLSSLAVHVAVAKGLCARGYAWLVCGRERRRMKDVW